MPGRAAVREVNPRQDKTRLRTMSRPQNREGKDSGKEKKEGENEIIELATSSVPLKSAVRGTKCRRESKFQEGGFSKSKIPCDQGERSCVVGPDNT